MTMIDQEIQSKLKSLRVIEPTKDYAGSSRVLLLNKEIIEDSHVIAKLGALKALSPDANYAFQTKLSILEAGKLNRNKLVELFTFKNFLNSSLALGLTAVLMGVLVTGGYRYLSPAPSLSLADNNALLNEAENVSKDIDIHLREAEYYASAARKTNLALNEASGGDYGHLNNTLIEREAGNIDIGSPVNRDVDALLNEATF